MIWPNEAGETTCGPGSTLVATRNVRDWLPGALERLGVRTLLDAPCGDRNWMRHVELPCAYVGADNELAHIERARIDDADVRALDICADELPRCDAVLARDFFQHLSRASEARALENINRTGATYIITTCHGQSSAGDIADGGFRYIDRREQWGEPIDQCDDGKHGRILGVWAL